MKKLNYKSNLGYIEGFYGKILNWDSRNKIIDSLSNHSMKYYFYAPKEDICHRLLWRKSYPKSWINKFKNFCEYANSKGIRVIAGISPGLDYNFEIHKQEEDFKLLVNKIRILINNGANQIAILFDDIPENFEKKFKNLKEGFEHAKLLNKLKEIFDNDIFLVPRIYADELNYNKNYIYNLLSNLNNNIKIFYCGEHIVSSTFKSSNKFLKDLIKQDRVIFWDNFYANDYCPKKFIIGPWKIKHYGKKFMFNLTGMINTDLLIIRLISLSDKNNTYKNWKKIILENDIPKQFFEIKNYFLKPVFSNEKKLIVSKPSSKIISAIDYLLWKWKTPLSLEWYPYLLILKHDLQLLNDNLSYNRILKIHTIPMSQKLLKK